MRRRFVGLDALRGIAAAVVALLHLKYVFHLNFDLPNAPLAVDFFFMLSGFVLAHGYGEKLANGQIRAYLVARVVRLFPLIIFSTLCASGALIALGHPPGFIARLGAYGALSVPYLGPVPFTPSIAPLNPPAWSLFFELVASGAFGFGLWRGKWADLTVAAGLLAMIGVLALRGQIHVGHDRAGFEFGFARVGFGFGLGTWLYRAPLRVPSIPLPILATIVALLLLCPFENRLLQAWLIFAAFPLIVMSAAESETTSHLWSVTGNLSYPLYLMHWPTYLWISVFWSVRHAAGAATAFVAAILVAFAALKLYDIPVRRRLSASTLRLAKAS